MKQLLPYVAFAAAMACGPAAPPAEAPQPAAKPARSCAAALPGTVAVLPLKNKTQAKVELSGTDDLVSTALLDSGCFTVLERDQMAVLIEEMRFCDENSPNRPYFDCGSFAKKGRLLGATIMILGDLAFYEANVKGADLSVKLPGIGGIDAGRSYAALAINLRAVEVETGRVRHSSMVHAVVPADRVGAELSAGGFELRAAATSRTPMGEALQGMIQQAVSQLRQGLAS